MSMNARQHGFSFIEVIIALSILLVGSVSILSLFSIGVWHQTERRIEERVQQVKQEIETIVQEEVDKLSPGAMPKTVKERQLTLPGYTVNIQWSANPALPQGVNSGVFAHAVLRFRGNPVRTLKPIPVTRSTLNPRPKNDDPN